MSNLFQNLQDQNNATRNIVVERGAERGVHRSVGQEVSDVATYTKEGAKQKSQAADVQASEHSQVAGAFYLALNKPAGETFEEVTKALEQMEDTDFSVQESDLAAHGILYSDDKFMLARTKIVKLVSDTHDGEYLEVNKLEGDGFVFADIFKKNLVDALGGTVKDDETVQPDLEEESVDMKYLDFSADEDSAMILMNKLLTNLKPKEGVKYDQNKIYESVSTLGHNVQAGEANFSFVNGFQEHIFPAVLEVLRHEETSSLPTVYFGSKLVSSFLSSEVLESEFKSWTYFQMLAEALKMHCLGEAVVSDEIGSPLKQVTKSRQSMKTLVDALLKMADLCEDELTPKIKDSCTQIFEQIPDEVSRKTLLEKLA